MTESTMETWTALLFSATGLLLVTFIALVVIARRLGHIRAELARAKDISPEKVESRSESRSGAFAKFMIERPELAELSKSEQFAAFRKWRKEQGLNWETR